MQVKDRAEKKIIEISIKSDYLPLWGFWEGVREIIQNAIDAGLDEVFYSEKEKALIVKDRGPGFSEIAFLIGYTTKDGINSIGQFGEGLKFGSLALVRGGYPVEIRTKNKVYTPLVVLSERFGTEVLGFEVEENAEFVNGTEVKILNVYPSEWEIIKDRILVLQPDYEPSREILTEEKYKGKVYCTGIFVHKLKRSIWGYNFNNLTINRDRDIVDEWSLKEAIGYALGRITDYEIIKEFVANLANPDVTESSAVMTKYTVPKENWPLWQKAWKEVWGENCVVETEASLRNQLEYCGYRGLKLSYTVSPAFEAIIGTDVKVVESMKKNNWRDEGPIDLRKYPILRKIAKGFPQVPIHWFSIKHKKLEIRAMVRDGRIYLNSNYKKDEPSLVACFLHELVHILFGFNDNTPEFLEGYHRVCRKAFQILSKKGRG